jgi:hypothetical protein
MTIKQLVSKELALGALEVMKEFDDSKFDSPKSTEEATRR